MIESNNEVSKDLEKALQVLAQAKQRVANEKKKQSEKKRKAENHHKYIMGGIIVKYFPDCYRYDEGELNRILSVALQTKECYEKVGRTDKDRWTGKEREPIDKAYYICQTYNRLGKNACTSHKIEARDLYNLVLSDIQEVAAMALKDKEAFYGRLSQRMEKQYLADTDSLKKEYESLVGRNQEIDDTFISLYADKAKGILTEKRFLKLTDAMEKEQESNQNRMQEIAALISEEEHSEGDVQMFMGGKSGVMLPLQNLTKRY